MVYISPIQASLRNKNWPYKKHCCLIADSLIELHRFALLLGLRRSWFQKKTLPHYDLTINIHAKAKHLGAIEISNKEVVKRLRKHRLGKK